MISKKFKITIVSLIALVFLISAAFSYRYFTAPQSNSYKIYNFQKLERQAHSGDIEAMIRLANFLRKNGARSNGLDKKKEYWHGKIKDIENTPEYKIAADVIYQEQAEQRAKEDHKFAIMNLRMEELKNKYESMEEGANKIPNEKIWLEGLDAVFGIKNTFLRKKSYTWRYKIIVKINTPEGIKTGSTIHELYFPVADKKTFTASIKGIYKAEAVFVDLGKRGVIFGVFQGSGDSFQRRMLNTFPTVPKIHDNSRWSDVISHYGRLRDVKDKLSSRQYPIFVHFKDTNDPTSIELVYKREKGRTKNQDEFDINRFEEVFGKGVSINEITLEMNNEPFKWKLDKKLPWINMMSEDELRRITRKSFSQIDIGISAFRYGYKTH